eukprot:TRINITY_DN5264_c0_g1_i1.p1 TRINITY_DN5264_c0_g1~~TRINITY_DN5264_c0_g1_i1.p1  ORF type:complete len:112 (-),score=17.10 TRINITY_DN5264_c0_g1_i1:186-521(-)
MGMTKYRRTKKSRGYKACDPACKQADRVAMYKSANGPIMGKFISGKTKVPGLKGKGLTKRGQAKKGFRNLPIVQEKLSKSEQRKLAAFEKLCGPRKTENERKEKQRVETSY